MPDEFDGYREALVVETSTIWPDEYADMELSAKQQIAEALHAEPQTATQLQYVRMHSGFCRQITVTAEDIARLGG